MNLRRRKFLQVLMAGAGAATLWPVPLSVADPLYSGRLLITIHAAGGWDVSSFCDPKLNVPGEAEINWWARNQDIQTAGNINYAPFGNNDALFQKYHNYMLVINGVDAQTNAHEAGVVHNWSGRVAAGYPSLSALFAAHNAPDLPMTLINYGGYPETAKLTRYTRLDSPSSLRSLLAPNVSPWSDNQLLPSSEYDRILAAHSAWSQSQLDSGGLLPGHKRLLQSQLSAFSQTADLERFLAVIPPDEEIAPVPVLYNGFGGVEQPIMRDAQLSLLAFQSGVACASDLIVNSFDTHGEHDLQHEPGLGALADGIDYLWDYAEQLGLADRLTVVIGSDFSRTPFYNDTEGKDHWPVGSVIVMEKNASWGNRVVGLTDEGQNAYKINPATLQRDDTGGTIIYPKHIHKALRTYLGLDTFSPLNAFGLSNTEDFDFFNPDLMTAGRNLDPRNSQQIV